MCGISGFINLNHQTLSKVSLETMMQLQNHRGPDTRGIYYNHYVGLAHNRLSLLDLSDNGKQPFENERFVLVYNGEIYNYLELKKELPDIEYKSSSDTAVLFHALQEWGIAKTVSKIKGMFAFAWYDKKENELTLVRDRIGIKPLFYGIDKDNTYWFASEVKSLLAVMYAEVNPVKLLYSSMGILERSRKKTAWNNIFQVEPGTYLVFKDHQVKINKYYTIFETVNETRYNDLNKASEKEVLEEFDTLFSGAVDKMLMSDAPMGAFVSGGIDSSLIAHYATRKSSDLKLFTANVIGKHSEFEDAQLLAKSLQTNLYDYKFEKEMALRDWVNVTWHYESPIVVHFNAIPFSGVSKLAHQHQVKAVLTGEGADELFLGYPKLLTRRYEKGLKLPFTILENIYGLIPKLKNYVTNSGGSQDLLGLFNEASMNFRKPIVFENHASCYSFLDQKKQKEHWLTAEMMQDHIVSLLWRNDRMGMIHSIESRFPFLDEDLIAFSMNLPIQYKIGRTSKFYNYKHPFLIDKYIVRKLAENKLPKQLVEKKKNGFPMHALRDIAVKPAFFYDGVVASLFQMNQEQINYMCKSQNKYLVSLLASVEIWALLFVQNKEVEKVEEHVLKYVII